MRGKYQLKTVLDRLDDRISQGFGDFTAIKTETPVNKDGSLDKEHSALNLYSQNDSASLWRRYLVGEQFLPNGKQRGAPTISVPKGWPDPDIDDILEQVRSKRPSEFYVSNGDQIWPLNMPKASLPKEIWLGREQLLLNEFRAMPILSKLAYKIRRKKGKAKLLEDINRPGLVGLYAEGYIPRCDSPRRQRIEQILWIDPERDDMPVETLSRDYSQDEKTVKLKFLTKYLDYTQLSDSRWYPTRWQMTTEVHNRPDKDCREFHLQLFAEMKLDKSWFTDPDKRFANRISEE